MSKIALVFLYDLGHKKSSQTRKIGAKSTMTKDFRFKKYLCSSKIGVNI